GSGPDDVCEVPDDDDDDDDSGSSDDDGGYNVDNGAALHRAMAAL
ncbi:hypothetical protein Tco_0742258, partial [Tanacetum coccineum]